jgi:hypothetical protein
MGVSFYQPNTLPQTVQIGEQSLVGQNIQYAFMVDHFCHVSISFALHDNHAILHQLVECYGQPVLMTYPIVNKYIWRMKPTSIIMTVSPEACIVEYWDTAAFTAQKELEQT